jgi:hypothetical protein
MGSIPISRIINGYLKAKITIWKIINMSLNSIYRIKGISYNGNTATLHVVYLGSNPNISKKNKVYKVFN